MMRLCRLLLLLGWLGIQSTFFLAEKFYSYHNRFNQLVFSNHRPPAADANDVKEMEIQRDQPYLLQFDEDRYNRFDELILKHSQRSGVDFNLVKSMILVESNFNPKAVSPKGAQGLMQLIPDTATRFNVGDVFDPDENIRGGCDYLKYLIELFEGDLELVLSSYNAGENLVKRIQRIPDYRETRNYVAKIIQIYGRTRTSLEPFTILTPGSKFFKYVDENGVITLSNIDPPKGAKPVR
ncbi:MAG: lytic transglycosylase domain-containing protein [Acidobacteria bacterium]|nr:lytic transglycosylase domain-containing protein [Acidobacteriota bacterium]